MSAYFIYHINIMINLHPYQYVYYNQIAGGLKGANGKYETDYWGNSYKESTLKLINYLKNKDGNLFYKNAYKIYVTGPVEAASYYFPDNFKLEKNIENADYCITFTRTNIDRSIKYPTIISVERFGIPLSLVKEIK
jgi:hypothetical protein